MKLPRPDKIIDLHFYLRPVLPVWSNGERPAKWHIVDASGEEAAGAWNPLILLGQPGHKPDALEYPDKYIHF